MPAPAPDTPHQSYAALSGPWSLVVHCALSAQALQIARHRPDRSTFLPCTRAYGSRSTCALRTAILVRLRVIREALLAEIRHGLVLEIAQRDVGTHARVLDALMFSMVPYLVSPSPAWAANASETDPPEQIQHRLVVLHFGRGD